jgi:hypothetical protein
MAKKKYIASVDIALPANVADKYEVVGDIKGPVVSWRGTVDLRQITPETAAALVKDKFPHLKEKAAKPQTVTTPKEEEK